MSSLVAHSIDYTAREKIVEQHAAPGSGKTVMRDCKDIPPGRCSDSNDTTIDYLESKHFCLN